MEFISRDEAIKVFIRWNKKEFGYSDLNREMRFIDEIESLPTIEERKVGEWIRTGRTNVYGGEELMCPFCGDRVMVQNIEYELYCRQCGALLGDRAKGEADE